MLAEKEINRIPRPVIQQSVQYFDVKKVGRETKRWICFAGDLIVPARKLQIDWLKPGGEETNSGCLQKYGRGFIPRGLSSLMEMGADLMPEEHLRNVGGEVWQGMALNEEIIKNRLSYVPIYPGDGLNNLLNRSQNDEAGRKGLVENKSLMGKEWDQCHNPMGTGILDVIERAAFGDDFIIPPTLKELKDRILSVRANVPVDLGQYKEEWKQSCGEFELWASVKIGVEHTLLRQGSIPVMNPTGAGMISSGGHTYSYSPLAELLMVQLGIQRQDQLNAQLSNREIAEAIKTAIEGRPSGVSLEDMLAMRRDFESSIESKLATAREADQRQIVELKAQLAQSKAEAEIETEGWREPEVPTEPQYDLSGERPANVHPQTWKRLRREAGIEE
jgi:hypothetical protein